jgi:alpha-tubulin suppressor-like RCC1 family protein
LTFARCTVVDAILAAGETVTKVQQFISNAVVKTSKGKYWMWGDAALPYELYIPNSRIGIISNFRYNATASHTVAITDGCNYNANLTIPSSSISSCGNKLYTMGSNVYGLLGDGTTVISTNQKSTPTAVADVFEGQSVVSVAMSTYAALALLTNGTVAVWGRNDNCKNNYRQVTN